MATEEDIDPTAPPIAARTLERLRLAAGRSWPSAGIGPHMRRKQGQSLQFREFRDYQPGEDIRNVDWRMSARRVDGEGAWRLTSRSFDAEERMTLALVLDVRAAMRLPKGAEKLRVGLWYMRALAAVAGAWGDDVILATIFGPWDRSPRRARGRKAPLAAAQFAREIWQSPAPLLAEPPEAPHLGAVVKLLKPAGVTVLISDMLFPATDALRAFAVAAQASRRSLVVCQLDSFSAERALMERQPSRRLAPVEGRVFAPSPVLLDDTVIAETHRRIEAHLANVQVKLGAGGLVWDNRRPSLTWPSRPDPAALADSFRASLFGLPALQAVSAARAV